VTIQDARIRLEGGLELLEATRDHLDAVRKLLEKRDWQSRIRIGLADIDAIVAAEPNLTRALEHARREPDLSSFLKRFDKSFAAVDALARRRLGEIAPPTPLPLGTVLSRLAELTTPAGPISDAPIFIGQGWVVYPDRLRIVSEGPAFDLLFDNAELVGTGELLGMTAGRRVALQGPGVGSIVATAALRRRPWFQGTLLTPDQRPWLLTATDPDESSGLLLFGSEGACFVDDSVGLAAELEIDRIVPVDNSSALSVLRAVPWVRLEPLLAQRASRYLAVIPRRGSRVELHTISDDRPQTRDSTTTTWGSHAELRVIRKDRVWIASLPTSSGSVLTRAAAWDYQSVMD
jgi:hypothetical protein